ncbi:hypothetical protein HID58_021483 [Brassica napus]|uniref:Uncharacterized protein n=1 Tax=Brassica napus TaxID=3708 RepID=A0ABQ8CWI1_BRANA|nr:hypothetical protein HID58_021483 [Brassica napus]
MKNRVKMKFGKEFSSQMVPEWQQAYMDYGSLKKSLKEIIGFKLGQPADALPTRGGANNHHGGGLHRRMTLRGHSHDVEEGLQMMATTGPILVETNADGSYETTFLMVNEKGGEYELVFFRRLDEEFNKVSKFYKEEVDKVSKEEKELNKQMEALIAFRAKVENQEGSGWRLQELPKPTELIYSRENLKKAEQMLIEAFSITSRDATKPYMKMVDSSYLGSSDEVVRLMEHVEATFIKHFANANRTKGMNILRPKAKRERHRLTFSTGFSAGCIFSLIVALAAIIRTRNLLQEEGQAQYMDTMFPLYSLFGFIVLHIIMFAGNIYYWRRYKVNYSFIFGFKEGTELGYRQVLLVAFSTGVLALLCVLANLDMEVDPVTKDYQAFTELLPLILLLGIFAVLVMPFNFFYRSNRIFFLTCLFHCMAAPLYKVTLPDFFLGDQLTSQVQALRSIEFYICYYGWGDFRHRNNTCNKSGAYKGFFFIVAVIPYVSRLLQCLRRLFEEDNPEQGWNGLKYFLTIVAICLRTAYSIQQGQIAWRVLAAISSAAAAIFCTYWDFIHDWGLLKRTSKNRWLRDKLLIPQKKVYFIAMILNVLLRFAWIQTVMDFNFSFMHKQTMVAVVASLEIIRRGIWNFFRLENEHLNNVGKYRAFKSVPLPFNYDKDEDKDD